jgi:TonB family protein
MTPDLDRAARALLLLVVDASLRALVLAAMAALLLTVVRPRRAAVRLGVWSAVLYGSLLVPAFGAVLPAVGWPVSVPMAMQQAWTAAEPSSATALLQSAAAARESSRVAAATAQTTAAAKPWLAGAAAIYAVGALVLLLRAAVGWHLTRRLARDGRPIDDGPIVARVRNLAVARGMSRPPRLAEAERLRVPVTMSVIDPVVLLPSDWHAWSPETLDAVLAHEVAHAARRDVLTQRISLLYRALTWCHPLSWWLHRRLADLAEQASDEAALEAGAERTAYATVLVDFFARIRHEPRRAAWHVAMARRADAGAERRVDRILNWKGVVPMRHTRLSLIAIIAVAAPVVALTAALRPVVSVAADTSNAPTLESTPPVTNALPDPDDQNVSRATATSLKLRAAPLGRARQAKPTTSTGRPAPPSAPVQGATKSEAQLIEEFRAGAHSSTDLPPGGVEPVALRQVRPKYTSDAMRAKIQGTVILEAVVGISGTIERVRVVQSLDPILGLDLEALTAAQQWLFRPALVNDAPVASYVTLHLEFKLH